MLFRFGSLIFALVKCSLKNYCLKSLFLMRFTGGNKKVPQTFSHNSLYSRKYDLIRLNPRRWQPAFRNFVTSQKANFAKFLPTKKRDVW